MIIENHEDFDEVNINKKYKKLSSENVLVKEVNDIYDGPLSGICEFLDKEYYFCCISEFEHLTEKQRYPRKYVLIKLNEDLLNRQMQINKLTNKKLKSEKEELKLRSLIQESFFIPSSEVVGWYEVNENKSKDVFLQSYYKWLHK